MSDRRQIEEAIAAAKAALKFAADADLDTLRWLSPRSCAEALGVTDEFIRGEIKASRLAARVFTRASGRSVYRIEARDFRTYAQQHWPKKVA